MGRLPERHENDMTIMFAEKVEFVSRPAVKNTLAYLLY
jgi:hypothetical protein